MILKYLHIITEISVVNFIDIAEIKQTKTKIFSEVKS